MTENAGTRPTARQSVFLIGMSCSPRGEVSGHFRALAQALAGRGHRVVLIADQRSFDAEDPDANPAVDAFPSRTGTTARDLWFLLKLIRSRRPDCMIGVFRPVNIMMIAGWMTGVPHRVAWYRTVSTQSVHEPDGPGRLKRMVQVQRKKWVYKLATRVITASRAMIRDLRKVYRVPDSKVRVFPNAVPAPEPRLCRRAKNGHSLACIGRYCNLKGQATLVRAVAMIKGDIPDLTVDFYGSGDPAPLRALARELGVDGLCRIHGPLAHPAVIEKMAASAVTIVPSRDEAFGFVNIESMSVGTPVIASRVGGIPEILRDGIDGFLIPPDDPAALALRIRRLLADAKLRRTMGRNCRERFLECFEQRRSVESQAVYFERLAASAEPGVLACGK